MVATRNICTIKSKVKKILISSPTEVKLEPTSWNITNVPEFPLDFVPPNKEKDELTTQQKIQEMAEKGPEERLQELEKIDIQKDGITDMVKRVQPVSKSTTKTIAKTITKTKPKTANKKKEE